MSQKRPRPGPVYTIVQADKAAAAKRQRVEKAKAQQAARGFPPSKARPTGRGNLRQIPRGFVGLAGDRKFVDTALATYACNTTGSITHISIVPTGTTVSTREGKAFRVTSCQIRGSLFTNSATTVATGMVLLVWDYQPNKALAAITDILDTVGAYSFIKRENNARFKILMKRRYAMTGNTTTPATGGEIKDIDEFINMPNDAYALCTVADTTGAIGNRINGALLLVTVGDTAAGTGDIDLTCTIRTNFTE